MRQRSRTFSTIKWGGTLLCLLIACAFVYSSQRAVYWTTARLDQIYLMRGLIGYGRLRTDARVAEWTYRPSPGWIIAHYGGKGPLSWWIDAHSDQYWHGLGVPLWMPFVALAIPTAVLWYRDRRRVVAGHCSKCGYDLTGNTSGRCPECGTAIPT